MEIKEYKQWLLWRFVNGAKVPINRWGEHSGSTRTSDYMTYDTAMSVDDSRTLNGVMGPAFCFTSEDPFFGVDLDDARCPKTGEMKPWAKEVIEMLNSYTEVSPSLSGYKIYCKGKLPEKIRHSVVAGDGMIEVYETGRFFTFTGLHQTGTPTAINEPDVEAFVGKYELELPKEPSRRSVAISASGAFLVDRAISYSNSVTATEGSRNTTAFNLCGHLLSMTDEDGRGLNDSELSTIMHGWNSMQVDPLPASELDCILRKIRKVGTPRQEKPANTLTVPDIDISSLEASYEIEPSKNDVLEFPKLEFHGLVGELTRFISESALYKQPEFAFGAALALMSTLTGRKIRDRSGARTNLYIACIGPSGCGKDWPRQVMQRVFNEVDSPDMFGPQDIGSSAGLMRALMDITPCQVFPLDELGMLLGNVNAAGAKAAHLSNIGKAFLELYGSAGRTFKGAAYADVTKTPIIDAPHAVIYGSSTPSTFWEGMTFENLTSGLMARFLIFDGEYVDAWDDHEEMDIPQGIINACRAWVEYHPVAPGNMGTLAPKTVDMSSDASDRFKEHRAEINRRRRNESEPVAALWSRVAEKSQKIAMLLAAGRHRPEDHIVINAEDMDAAIKISNWACRYLIGKFPEINDTAWGRQVRKVEEFIKQKGTTTMSQITNQFRGIKKRERTEIVSQLTEMGVVELEVTQSGGRPKTIIVYKEG